MNWMDALTLLVVKYIDIQSFGMIASTVTTTAFGLQALKTWKTRDVTGISLKMYLLFFFGVALWAVYGLMLNEKPLIISQLITLAFAGVVLTVVLQKNKKKVT